MGPKKKLIPIIAFTLLSFSCVYIVTPAELRTTPTPSGSKGWSAIVTNLGKSDAGDLHIDLALRNDTQDWSVMQAATDHPAVLKDNAGKTTNCATVFVGTGGHRLAPGFQMRGYTAGTKAAPVTQLLYVECKGAVAAPGMKLTVEYSYVTGYFNYYVTSATTNAKMELDLDQVASDLKYPVATTVPGLAEKLGAKITAINSCTLTLTDAKRTDTGLEFSWETENPGASPTYVHIGNPPVIGQDGIIYGRYESPTLADAPITLPDQKADWKTTATVPSTVTGLYILLSVEDKQQKNFYNHLIDITDK